MEKTVQNTLIELNRVFYDRYADSFSATRGHVQPGVKRIMQRINIDSSVLDVGCGNGNLARTWQSMGFSGYYLGIDMSQVLLEKASSSLENETGGRINFKQIDLSTPDWQTAISPVPFDWVVAFAVLHHLPGNELRRQIVRSLAELVSPATRIAVSAWQWQHSPRLKKRISPWESVGLTESDLEEGDVLLDWRAGNTPGLRYVHTFTASSLSELANTAGFKVCETFYSDGHTGNMGLYQVWQLCD